MKSYLDYDLAIINNSKLPTYPIPNMEDTLERFLEWVKPLTSQEEYLHTAHLVDDFINSHDSKKLHKKLEELGSRKDDNWLYDYWFKSYLKSRDPFVPYISVPMVYENSSLEGFSVTEKAAALIYSVANVYKDFKENPNGDYYMGKKRYSTDQFHGSLASINHIEKGINKYYINSNFSTNIVIIYRNHIYSLEIIVDSKKVANLDAIYNGIKEIYSESLSPIIPNINFLTSEPDKDIAADYLAQILKDPRNKAAYEKIKNSIFILNLDDDNPKSVIDRLYSTCMDTQYFNRWHGKGLMFSIGENGAMSFIVDHACSDAGTAIYLTNQMNYHIKDFSFTEAGDILSYQELLFYLDDGMKMKLTRSFEDYKMAMDGFEARYVELDGLSRSYLKEKGVLSGDGFFHIALQAAQKMTYGSIYNTYISVDMRMFFKGRTEGNRPVTAESVDFIEALFDPEEDILRQKDLLKKALDAHYHRTILCREGKGVNRYLYVMEELYMDYKDELDLQEKPPLFHSIAYRTLIHNKISATSFSNDNLKYSYFPPVTKGGLGIYYVICDKSFAIVTSFNEDLEMMKQFNKNLKICVNKMLKVIK